MNFNHDLIFDHGRIFAQGRVEAQTNAKDIATLSIGKKSVATRFISLPKRTQSVLSNNDNTVTFVASSKRLSCDNRRAMNTIERLSGEPSFSCCVPGEPMQTYDPTQPILYTHIPKCAGTSVVRLLRDWFATGYHKLNQDETRDIVLPRVACQDDKGRWLKNVKCIHGHFNHGRGYGLPYFYPEIKQYFTILRDPFDLVCSMYFFAKGKSAAGRFWFRGHPVDIREQFPNVESYVRSYPYWLFDHLPQDITLETCEKKLDEHFVYIGIFEDLQTSIDNLAKVLGKPQTQLPRMNVSKYDENIPEYLRGQFYRDYPLLEKVYDYALDRYRSPNELPPELWTQTDPAESPTSDADNEESDGQPQHKSAKAG